MKNIFISVCVTSSNKILLRSINKIIFIAAGKMYIVSVSVCCVFVPTVAIIVSHIGIFRAIRDTGKMFSNKAAGKQSDKAEIQFIRVNICTSPLFSYGYSCYVTKV